MAAAARDSALDQEVLTGNPAAVTASAATTSKRPVEPRANVQMPFPRLRPYVELKALGGPACELLDLDRYGGVCARVSQRGH